MSDIDGLWKISIATPMGTQHMGLNLTVGDDGQLSGTSDGNSGTVEIRDGKVDGNDLEFFVDATAPFPMTLRFVLAVSGDSLAGICQANSFPPSPVTGERA